MASGVDEIRERARAHFEADEFEASLEAALEGLASAPEDPELLLLAGQASVEVDDPEAVARLRRLTELKPDDARGWHSLGEALAAEGSTAEAGDAFRKAVELDPEDQVALSHLGHTSLATGKDEEGMQYLRQAAESVHGASTAAISLVDMYRTFGQHEQALAQAQKLAEADPDDVVARLDVAELSLQTGDLDAARASFERLRELDDVPEHEVYPLHGMIQVEIRRERWDEAHALLGQAAAIDPRGLSTDVAAFVSRQRGEDAEEPVPTREEVESSLQMSLAEYRRMHDRRVGIGEILG
jgi:Flp pilus assembly protein TadD